MNTETADRHSCTAERWRWDESDAGHHCGEIGTHDVHTCREHGCRWTADTPTTPEGIARDSRFKDPRSGLFSLVETAVGTQRVGVIWIQACIYTDRDAEPTA